MKGEIDRRREEARTEMWGEAKGSRQSAWQHSMIHATGCRLFEKHTSVTMAQSVQSAESCQNGDSGYSRVWKNEDRWRWMQRWVNPRRTGQKDGTWTYGYRWILLSLTDEELILSQETSPENYR